MSGVIPVTVSCNGSFTVTFHVYEASVDSADVTENDIGVTLGGPTPPIGNLVLEYFNAATQMYSPVRFPVHIQNLGEGTHSLQFDPSPAADYSTMSTGEFTHLSARWVVTSGLTVRDVMPYHIRNYGMNRMTQYNFPEEAQATCQVGGTKETVCVWSDGGWVDGSFFSTFSQEVWENGSGVSISFGDVKKEYFHQHPGCPRKHFRAEAIGTGYCAGQPLSTTTVAAHEDAFRYGRVACGDDLYIRQQDVVKTVADKGGWSTQYSGALDHFSTDPGCNTVSSFPDSVYIKLY